MVRPRADNYDQKKLEILDAAAEMFAERGFDGTSISAIVKRCGVSKALLYHYYQSKEALLYSMLLAHCQLLVDTVSSAMLDVEDPKTRLQSVVRALMQLYLTSRNKHVVLLNNLHALPQEQQAEIKELERSIVKTIKGIVSELRPDLKSETTSALSMNLMGAVNWTYTWFNPDGRISARDYADLSTTVFVEGIASC
ncbi:MAG: TetR/AcrR family transcriptional regulator [Candidatus Obscuribacterales bacterium]|nr:TetR/AcrR family transcriptional regulator [Candidatus Obscuribacterales bacterium]